MYILYFIKYKNVLLFNLSGKILSNLFFLCFLKYSKFSKTGAYYHIIEIIYQVRKCIFAKTLVPQFKNLV